MFNWIAKMWRWAFGPSLKSLEKEVRDIVEAAPTATDETLVSRLSTFKSKADQFVSDNPDSALPIHAYYKNLVVCLIENKKWPLVKQAGFEMFVINNIESIATAIKRFNINAYFSDLKKIIINHLFCENNPGFTSTKLGELFNQRGLHAKLYAVLNSSLTQISTISGKTETILYLQKAQEEDNDTARKDKMIKILNLRELDAQPIAVEKEDTNHSPVGNPQGESSGFMSYIYNLFGQNFSSVGDAQKNEPPTIGRWW